MKGNKKITIALVGMACLCSNLPTTGYAKDGGDGKVVPGIVNSKPRHNVKGTVKDSDGEPIIGANILKDVAVAPLLILTATSVYKPATTTF